MIQINLNGIKWSRVLHYAITILLLVVVFFKFNGTNELKMANSSLEKDVKSYKANAKKYVYENNLLKDSITLLETRKAKAEKEIVYIEKESQSKLEKVPSMSTKNIANYYQKRYTAPVVITQYGVALSDSIAKKNIKETIEKDYCFQEIKLVKEVLSIEEKKGEVKDSINQNLTKAFQEIEKANTAQTEMIQNVEKSLKKEKRKKTFWKVATVAAISASAYLLITK